MFDIRSIDKIKTISDRPRPRVSQHSALSWPRTAKVSYSVPVKKCVSVEFHRSFKRVNWEQSSIVVRSFWEKIYEYQRSKFTVILPATLSTVDSATCQLPPPGKRWRLWSRLGRQRSKIKDHLKNKIRSRTQTWCRSCATSTGIPVGLWSPSITVTSIPNSSEWKKSDLKLNSYHAFPKFHLRLQNE